MDLFATIGSTTAKYSSPTIGYGTNASTGVSSVRLYGTSDLYSPTSAVSSDPFIDKVVTRMKSGTTGTIAKPAGTDLYSKLVPTNTYNSLGFASSSVTSRLGTGDRLALLGASNTSSAMSTLFGEKKTAASAAGFLPGATSTVTAFAPGSFSTTTLGWGAAQIQGMSDYLSGSAAATARMQIYAGIFKSIIGKQVDLYA